MARQQFKETVASIAQDGTLKAISNVQVTVYLAGTTDLATIYEGRSGGALNDNPFVTPTTGLALFWANPGAFDVKYHDLESSPRIGDITFGWESVPGAAGGIPTSLLAQDGGLAIAHLAADIMRQFSPLGAIEDWWRPTGAYPLPSGWAVCNGQSVASVDHDFETGSAITLPDLRNKFVIGADALIADGSVGSAGDGSSAYNVAHPNAPGIGGAGGANALKNLAHVHNVDIPHTHDAGTLFADNHSHGAGSMSTGYPSKVALGTDYFIASGGLDFFASGADWHTHLVGGATAVATADVAGNTGSHSLNSNSAQPTWDSTPGSDFRPRYVGLLKIMKVKRS